MDDMKNNLPHDYGMMIRTADDGDQEIRCRAMNPAGALNQLHRQAQARWPADAYRMTQFWEEYPTDFRNPPTVRRSPFDLPKGPNPVHEKRAKPVDATLAMFDAAEMDACQKSVRHTTLFSDRAVVR